MSQPTATISGQLFKTALLLQHLTHKVAFRNSLRGTKVSYKVYVFNRKQVKNNNGQGNSNFFRELFDFSLNKMTFDYIFKC